MNLLKIRKHLAKRKWFSYKESQRFNVKKAFLITSYQLLITTALTGCMGVYEGGFECPPGEGVGCKSISEVNEMVDRQKLPQGELSEVPNCKTCGEASQEPSIWYSPWFYRRGNDIYESI